jgi:hypothetical protein
MTILSYILYAHLLKDRPGETLACAPVRLQAGARRILLVAAHRGELALRVRGLCAYAAPVREVGVLLRLAAGLR